MAKYRIVMVRHGESEWNQLNLFCGWFDAGLSEKGEYNLKIYCSRAKRSHLTKYKFLYFSFLKKQYIFFNLFNNNIAY